MRILVTGREGQVARSLAALAIGHELVFAARPEFDLADFASIEASIDRIRPDLVISAAAYTAVDRAEDEPELALRLNGAAPGVLARSAARIGAPVIHLSTDYVFDGTGEAPWRETDPVAPINAYGRSKATGEEAVEQSGADYAILRTAWVYSPWGGNFVRTMLRLAGERDSLRVVADQTGNPTSAADIARGIAAVIAQWQAGPRATGIFHLAGTGETSWAGFAEAIFAESAACGGPGAEVVPIPSSEYPTKAKRPANSRLDCGRFVGTFGWRPRPWREALAPVVREILES
jgi:dTDP-4-dehydrorhamnose reductase